MSTQVFPSLIGQGWGITRSPIWKTLVNQAVSGRETRMGLWSYPIYEWELTFNFLRIGTMRQTVYSELQSLMGLFNKMNGSFDSFLYTDGDDNAVTGANLGLGNGSTTQFQLVRSFGSFIEPVFAPNTVTAVYLNGVLQSGANYTVSGWGTATPGVITFVTPPAGGVVVTADFSYYFPCRFSDDRMDFNKFMQNLYEAQSVKFRSIKL